MTIHIDKCSIIYLWKYILFHRFGVYVVHYEILENFCIAGLWGSRAGKKIGEKAPRPPATWTAKFPSNLRHCIVIVNHYYMMSLYPWHLCLCLCVASLVSCQRECWEDTWCGWPWHFLLWAGNCSFRPQHIGWATRYLLLCILQIPFIQPEKISNLPSFDCPTPYFII